MSEDSLDSLDSWIPGFSDFLFPDSWILEFLDSLIPGFLDSWIPGFLDLRIPGFRISEFPYPKFPDSQIPGFYCFFSLQIIEEACKKKLRKKHFVIWYFLYTNHVSTTKQRKK